MPVLEASQWLASQTHNRQQCHGVSDSKHISQGASLPKRRPTLLMGWKAHPGAVMQAKDGAHEVRQRMVPKVGGHIRHAQPLARRQRHSLQETQSPSALQNHPCTSVSRTQQQDGLHALRTNTEQSQLIVRMMSTMHGGSSHPGVRQGGRPHAGGGERAVLRVLGADGQRQVCAEGVGHRVEGLHWWQAAAVQVVSYLCTRWAISYGKKPLL